MKFKQFVSSPLTAVCAAAIFFGPVLPLVASRQIDVYTIPKEATHNHDEHAGHGHAAGVADPHAGVTTGMPRVKVAKLPEGWKENPNPGSMRAASFLVTGEGGNEAEVAVIPMGGMANIELQLVNMWRDQVKLPAITEAEMGGQSTEVPIGDSKGKLFDLASTETVLGGQHKARILVAMLKQADLTWFFKFAGEAALVSNHREAFLEFLKGVSFESPAMPAGHPPVGGGMAGGTSGGMGQGMGMMGGGATVPPGSGDQPQWQIPASWTEVAHSPFLVAKFQVSGEGDQKAEINVSTSAGAGGGLLPNVNRWRAQLNLGAWDQATLDKNVSSLDANAGNATVVDFSGEEAENGGKARCVGVTVALQDATWFYKLMGDESVVAREKDALLNFVRSVKH